MSNLQIAVPSAAPFKPNGCASEVSHKPTPSMNHYYTHTPALPSHKSKYILRGYSQVVLSALYLLLRRNPSKTTKMNE